MTNPFERNRYDIDVDKLVEQKRISPIAGDQMRSVLAKQFVFEIDGADLTVVLDLIRQSLDNTWISAYMREDFKDLYEEFQAQKNAQLDGEPFDAIRKEAGEHTMGLHDSDIEKFFEEWGNDDGPAAGS